MPRVQILLDVTVNREVDAPDFTGADLVEVVTGILRRSIPKRIPLSPRTTLVPVGPVKPSVVITFGRAQVGIVGDVTKAPACLDAEPKPPESCCSHRSDCAQHSEPYKPNGTCDCGAGPDAHAVGAERGQAVRVEMQRVERVGGQPSVSLEVA